MPVHDATRPRKVPAELKGETSPFFFEFGIGVKDKTAKF
jgi:hypothetical protein